MDLLVTGGRYLALTFLPAAVVSIMKNGLQLVFLAIIRWYRGKYISKYQWIGLSITWRFCFPEKYSVITCKVLLEATWSGKTKTATSLGLCVISTEHLMTQTKQDNASTGQSTIGVFLMVFVAMTGAIRNTLEEILLKEFNFHSDFIVGVESIVCAYFKQPFLEKKLFIF